jgi:hypothetical protein
MGMGHAQRSRPLSHLRPTAMSTAPASARPVGLRCREVTTCAFTRRQSAPHVASRARAAGGLLFVQSETGTASCAYTAVGGATGSLTSGRLRMT